MSDNVGLNTSYQACLCISANSSNTIKSNPTPLSDCSLSAPLNVILELFFNIIVRSL